MAPRDRPPLRAVDDDGDVDPELLSLRPSLRRPRPLVAAALILLAAYLAVWLWGDLRYYLGPHAPRDLGTVAHALTDAPRDGSYVTVHGTPLRPADVLVGDRGSSTLRVVAPFIGSGDRLLLAQGDAPRSVQELSSDARSGRLRRLDAADFGKVVRAAFAAQERPRYVRPVDLLAALVRHARSIRDELGETAPLVAGTPLLLDVRLAGDSILSFDRGRFTDAEAVTLARRLVAGVGGALAQVPIRTADGSWLDLVVRLPPGVAAPAIARAIEPYAGKVRLAPRIVSIRLPAGAIAADGRAGLLRIDTSAAGPNALPVLYRRVGAPPASVPAVAASRPAISPGSPAPSPSPASAPGAAVLAPSAPPATLSLSIADVTRARVLASGAPPADAWVLLEGDAPAGYWYVPPTYVLLLFVLAFNLLALRAGLRRRKAPESTST